VRPYRGPDPVRRTRQRRGSDTRLETFSRRVAFRTPLCAVGAILAGVIADAFGIETAIWTVAVITALSGVVVALRMYETHPHQSVSSEVQAVSPADLIDLET
jgi:hypothetical protein